MSGHCGTRIRRRRRRRETTRTRLDVRTSPGVRTSLDARTSLKKSTSPRTNMINMINMINMTNMGRRKRKRRRVVHPPPPPHLHPPAVMRSDASWELRTMLLASYDLMILSIDKMTVWLECTVTRLLHFLSVLSLMSPVLALPTCISHTALRASSPGGGTTTANDYQS